MSDKGIGRREMLSGLVLAGGAGALVGGGTTSFLSDDETFANDTIQASTSVAGVVDMGVTIESLENGTGVAYSVTLPEGTGNNPAYIWVRTKTCPDPIELSDALAVELRVECNGTETVLYSGYLFEVLNELRDGELLVCFDNDGDQCLHPGEIRNLVLEVTDVEDANTAPEGPLEFEFEFYGEQCRYDTGATNPFAPEDVIEECDPPQTTGGNAISFIAFCSSEPDATLDPEIVAVNATDGSGDPTSVDWETDADVDYVVVKSSTGFTIYDYRDGDGDTTHETSGTAVSGDDPDAAFSGTISEVYCPGRGSNRPESCPCQAAVETVGDGGHFSGTSVKLEADEGELEP